MRRLPPVPLLSRGRGQTLVLFAIGLFILVLMVAMTLSTGMKVREKMEVQAVADAAAYTNATHVARAYNEIAVLNRAQIGKMVSMASTQSLISWAGYYRANLQASYNNYRTIRFKYLLLQIACCFLNSSCKSLCGCAKSSKSKAGKSAKKVKDKLKKKVKNWDDLDKTAALQVRLQQLAAQALFIMQTERWLNMRDGLNNQELAGKVVKGARQGARWPSEWSAPGGGDKVSLRESSPISGAILPIPGFKSHHIYAAMGSRGYTFTTRRLGAAMSIWLALRMDGVHMQDMLTVNNVGSGYFGNKPQPDHGKLLSTDGTFSWADDHGSNKILFGRAGQCPPFSSSRSVRAHVKSTDQKDETDQHFWSPSDGKDKKPAKQVHTLPQCIGPTKVIKMCPGVWPMFVDYNPFHLLFNAGDNNWGQPKTYASIQRNYAVRGSLADPWNFAFNYHFSPDGVSFDNNGLKLTSQGGLDISKQTALSAGLAYYHRYGHWKEPPNLLNPYWRATLAPYGIDEAGRKDNDVPKTLNGSGVPWAADAFKALRAVDYQGGP